MLFLFCFLNPEIVMWKKERCVDLGWGESTSKSKWKSQTCQRLKKGASGHQAERQAWTDINCECFLKRFEKGGQTQRQSMQWRLVDLDQNRSCITGVWGHHFSVGRRTKPCRHAGWPGHGVHLCGLLLHADSGTVCGAHLLCDMAGE